MDIYHYDQFTGVLLSFGEADESPAEPGVFLIPAFATDVVPPFPGPGEQVVFADGAWSIEPIPVPVTQNFTEAPAGTLFGGPTIKEVFYGDG